jgi:hypothetical protein
MSATTLTLGFSLKVKTYNALTEVQLLTIHKFACRQHLFEGKHTSWKKPWLKVNIDQSTLLIAWFGILSSWKTQVWRNNSTRKDTFIQSLQIRATDRTPSMMLHNVSSIADATERLQDPRHPSQFEWHSAWQDASYRHSPIKMAHRDLTDEMFGVPSSITGMYKNFNWINTLVNKWNWWTLSSFTSRMVWATGCALNNIKGGFLGGKLWECVVS